MMGFSNVMRAQGHAVESTCRVLREHGCQVAAQPTGHCKRPRRPIAARMLTDAMVVDAVRGIF